MVSRPTKWGNPFKAGDWLEPDSPLWPYLVTPVDDPRMRQALDGLARVKIPDVARAVEMHAWWILEQPPLMLALDELRGHDLLCWCRPGAPCHADTLLELANA